MTAELLGFALRGLDLTAALAPLSLAIALALLIRTRAQAFLVALNLWLFAELAATQLEPGYVFGDLLAERLLASILQVALAYGAILWWRSRRVGSRSVSAD